MPYVQEALSPFPHVVHDPIQRRPLLHGVWVHQRLRQSGPPHCLIPRKSFTLGSVRIAPPGDSLDIGFRLDLGLPVDLHWETSSCTSVSTRWSARDWTAIKTVLTFPKGADRTQSLWNMSSLMHGTQKTSLHVQRGRKAWSREKGNTVNRN